MRTAWMILLCLVIAACAQEEEKNPVAQGDPGVITVFVAEEYRDSSFKKLVRDAFGQPLPAVISKDETFEVTFSEESPKKAVDLNMLEFHIDPNKGEEVLTKTSGTYAQGQAHVIIYAPSIDKAKEVLMKHQQNIISEFNAIELKRVQKQYRSERNTRVSNAIYESQNIYVNLPVNFKFFRKDGKDFSLVEGEEFDFDGSNKMIIQEFFMLMQFPDDGDSLNLTEEGLIWQANRFMKSWTAYENDDKDVNAYFQVTPREHRPILSRPVEHRGFEALEIRGHLGVVQEDGKNQPFGGYFIALGIRDTKHNRMVLAIGMAKVPIFFSNREYLRHMEAIVYSVEPEH